MKMEGGEMENRIINEKHLINCSQEVLNNAFVVVWGGTDMMVLE